jgi:hypothetical protein
MKRTLAEHLGSTPHLSPLLRKARRLGLSTPEDLLWLAVHRGCTHYMPPDYDADRVREPGRGRLSDLELAIALCSGAQQYNPVLVRCAAQLLGADGVSAAALARLARMERCETVIRHIAGAAEQVDAGRETFWREVLQQLPVGPAPRAGVLPHSSRFMVQTGITGPKRAASPRRVWLRPQVVR